VWTGCSIHYISWNFRCSSYGSISLEIWDLIASASYNSEVGGLETHATGMIHYKAVKSAVELLWARIAQKINIIWKCEFLVNSQSLNWANMACFREKLPLGSLGSKKLATPESSFAELVVFQILNCTDAKLYHVITDQLVHY
jgi:hypothetical protein